MPYSLSPSTLSIYNECYRCFWLLKNKNIKRPSGPFPSLGSKIDILIKEQFDKYREKGEQPRDISNIKGHSLYENIDNLNLWRNWRKGLIWKDDKENILRGAIDDLLVKDEKLVVLDYKTRGYELKDDSTKYYQHQMDIYNFLLRKEGFETEDYAYLLFYIPTKLNDESLIQKKIPVKMNVSVENAENLFNEAIKTLSGEIPDKNEGCNYCKWNDMKS
jgi:hypothetical protein